MVRSSADSPVKRPIKKKSSFKLDNLLENFSINVQEEKKKPTRKYKSMSIAGFVERMRPHERRTEDLRTIEERDLLSRASRARSERKKTDRKQILRKPSVPRITITINGDSADNFTNPRPSPKSCSSHLADLKFFPELHRVHEQVNLLKLNENWTNRHTKRITDANLIMSFSDLFNYQTRGLMAMTLFNLKHLMKECDLIGSNLFMAEVETAFHKFKHSV